jgi:hypothetical protein
MARSFRYASFIPKGFDTLYTLPRASFRARLLIPTPLLQHSLPALEILRISRAGPPNPAYSQNVMCKVFKIVRENWIVRTNGLQNMLF